MDHHAHLLLLVSALEIILLVYSLFICSETVLMTNGGVEIILHPFFFNEG